MSLRPLVDFILIRPDENKTRFGSLIIAADNGLSRVSENVGTVVAVPKYVRPLPEKHDGQMVTPDVEVECPVKVGDRVVFRGFLSEVNPVEDGTCLIHHGDILAVVGEAVDVGPFSQGGGHGA